MTNKVDVDVEVQETVKHNTLWDMYKTNEGMERRGIVLDYGDAGYFIVARAGGANKNFSKVMEAKSRPHRRHIETGLLSNEIAEKLLVETFAETVVMDWGSAQFGEHKIAGPDGKPWVFSKENVVKLFTMLPDLFTDVREQASQLANFRATELENDLKN